MAGSGLDVQELKTRPLQWPLLSSRQGKRPGENAMTMLYEKAHLGWKLVQSTSFSLPVIMSCGKSIPVQSMSAKLNRHSVNGIFFQHWASLWCLLSSFAYADKIAQLDKAPGPGEGTDSNTTERSAHVGMSVFNRERLLKSQVMKRLWSSSLQERLSLEALGQLQLAGDRH